MGNWDEGQLTQLTAGMTLLCETLNSGQIYGIFFYNVAGNDNSPTVGVAWSSGPQPVSVTIPGTTDGEGLAAVALVSGNDTTTVQVSLSSDQVNAQLQCWIGSVSMPINVNGINNAPMLPNGQPQAFSQYDRYFAVPPSEWCTLTISSPDIVQFISVQFQENYATVYIVNPTQSGTDSNIFPISPSVIEGPIGKGTYSVVTPLTLQPPGRPEILSVPIEGDGTQWVWMNADSPQDSSSATISLQLGT